MAYIQVQSSEAIMGKQTAKPKLQLKIRDERHMETKHENTENEHENTKKKWV